MLIPGVVLLGCIIVDLIKKKRWVWLFFVWLVLFFTVLAMLPGDRSPSSEFDSNAAKTILQTPASSSKIDFQPFQKSQPGQAKGYVSTPKDLRPVSTGPR